jgi:hypothetical protein
MGSDSVSSKELLAILAALIASASLAASPALAYRFGEPAARATGPPEKVFDWSTTACKQNDIPDNPARVFRDATGAVQLIASRQLSRARAKRERRRLRGRIRSLEGRLERLRKDVCKR